MINWKEHKELQQALHAHLSKRGVALSGDELYESGIDCVFVTIQDNPVFIIGLPPVSNYPVDETEYTHRYFQVSKKIAV